MHTRCIVLNTISLAMGLLLGFSTWLAPIREQVKQPSVPTAAISHTTCPPTTLPAPIPASGGELSLSDIRNVIREELRAELVGYLAREAPPKEEPTPQHVKRTEAEQQLLYDKAGQVLRNSLSYGIWTQEDRQRLQSTLHELTIPQQDHLIGELFTAIQRGKLKVEGSGPPL